MNKNKHDQIKKLVQLQWMTFDKRLSSRFSDVLSKDKKKIFDENFVSKISEQKEKIDNSIIKGGILYYIIMFSLFMAMKGIQTGINILGVSINELYEARGLLILFIIILTPYLAIHSLKSSQLKILIKETLIHLHGATKFEFYSQKYLPDIIFHNFKEKRKHQYVHPITVVAYLLFLVMYMLTLLSLSAFCLYITALIFYDIYTNPIFEGLLNYILIFLISLTLIFQISYNIIKLPLPDTDYNNLYSLKELEFEDQARHSSIMQRIIARERRIRSIIGTVAYVSFSLLLFYHLIPEKYYFELYWKLSGITCALIVVSILNAFAIREVTQNISITILQNFSKYKSDIESYVRLKKFLLLFMITFSLHNILITMKLTFRIFF